jgi:hypothetical protein
MNDLTQQTCGGLGCHVEWSAASSAYNYLQSQGCLPAMGCIKGIGIPGNMPVIGNISSTATADIQAWVAAGSQNN